MSIPDLGTYLPEAISWCRDLHMHPELGLQEVHTSNLIADLLTRFGLDVQHNFAGIAVLGALHTNKPGKTVVLHADMDTLPVQDAKDVPYRSQISDVCHVYGHDAHTTNLLGVANYISDHRIKFCETIKFLSQPAEELLEGAELVYQSGVLDGTDYVLGQHAVLNVDVNQVQVYYGPSNGGSDEFTLRPHGVGCHGARPHTGKDSILPAVKVIEGFQQIISHGLDPLKAAVISVCSVQVGQHGSENVVPQEAVLAGTVRTLEGDVRTYVLTWVEEIVTGLCSAGRCSYTLEHVTKVPPLTSDQQLTQLVEGTTVELVGRENVLYRPAPTVGVENFSWYTRNYSAYMFYFGARNVKKGIIAREHNPEFDIDEECFRVAMPMFILLSKRLMLDQLSYFLLVDREREIVLELEYLKVANNPIVWISVLPGVLLIIVQAIVLSRRATVSERKMGITERQFKNAIRSSALVSIGLSLIIVTGMITLLSSMGGPIAWVQLAYIGAVSFELSTADRAASAVGCTLGAPSMVMEALACAVYTMVICCLGWILVSVPFAYKIGGLCDRVAGNNKAKMNVINIAGGMGACGYQCSNCGIVLAGSDTQTMTVIFGSGIMFTLAIYDKKKDMAWAKKFGVMIAILSGMLLGSFFS